MRVSCWGVILAAASLENVRPSRSSFRAAQTRCHSVGGMVLGHLQLWSSSVRIWVASWGEACRLVSSITSLIKKPNMLVLPFR